MTGKEFGNNSEKIRGRLTGLVMGFRQATGLTDLSEDIVQESLMRLWELVQKGYPVRDFEALAMKITKNLCVDRLRKRRLKQQPIIGDDYKGGTPASSSLDEADMSMVKEGLFDRLTPTQKKYIIMRNEWGMSLDEIARQTGSPKSSIKVTISNARRLMLEKIKEEL